MKAVVDADDLWHVGQIEEYIEPLLKELPLFQMTLYGIPNMLGHVHKLKKKYPRITFGIHGFEHTFQECLTWTDELAEVQITQALAMGYDPVFKAPNWIMDIETEDACNALGVVLHHQIPAYEPSLVGTKHFEEGLLDLTTDYLHTHIQAGPATDFIRGNPKFSVEHLKQYTEFLTPIELAQDL